MKLNLRPSRRPSQAHAALWAWRPRRPPGWPPLRRSAGLHKRSEAGRPRRRRRARPRLAPRRPAAADAGSSHGTRTGRGRGRGPRRPRLAPRFGPAAAADGAGGWRLRQRATSAAGVQRRRAGDGANGPQRAGHEPAPRPWALWHAAWRANARRWRQRLQPTAARERRGHAAGRRERWRVAHRPPRAGRSANARCGALPYALRYQCLWRACMRGC